jgi:hypothetical protein
MASETSTQESTRTDENNQPQESTGRTPPKKTRALLKLIHNTFDEIGALKLERKAIGEKIKAHLDILEAKQLSRRGLKAALSRYEQDEGERTDHDITYKLALEACGMQGELFSPDSEGDSGKVH